MRWVDALDQDWATCMKEAFLAAQQELLNFARVEGVVAQIGPSDSRFRWYPPGHAAFSLSSVRAPFLALCRRDFLTCDTKVSASNGKASVAMAAHRMERSPCLLCNLLHGLMGLRRLVCPVFGDPGFLESHNRKGTPKRAKPQAAGYLDASAVGKKNLPAQASAWKPQVLPARCWSLRRANGQNERPGW